MRSNGCGIHPRPDKIYDHYYIKRSRPGLYPSKIAAKAQPQQTRVTTGRAHDIDGTVIVCTKNSVPITAKKSTKQK